MKVPLYQAKDNVPSGTWTAGISGTGMGETGMMWQVRERHRARKLRFKRGMS